ncbi:hypothetical protein [Thiorhodospira sibirica]|uniref:hypothetical protein n=1 Tax=Thiorhodospira sibirica TaxID=154347 RepID=UPI001C8F02BB|nr:hypothetical protein [Thiorhodospira sibirica]
MTFTCKDKAQRVMVKASADKQVTDDGMVKNEPVHGQRTAFVEKVCRAGSVVLIPCARGRKLISQRLKVTLTQGFGITKQKAWCRLGASIHRIELAKYRENKAPKRHFRIQCRPISFFVYSLAAGLDKLPSF